MHWNESTWGKESVSIELGVQLQNRWGIEDMIDNKPAGCYVRIEV